MNDYEQAIRDARDRGERAAAQPTRYIDNATYRKQRAALTRAVNSGDPERIKATVIKTVRDWNAGNYAWPDAWSRWQNALDDALPYNARVLLDDIR